MQMRSSGARRFATACVLLALTPLATSCAEGLSGPGVDCAAIGRPPLTGADIDAVSDETALWLRSASEICGW
jgi:hypothetical protein